MKKTFTRTMMLDNKELQEATVKLFITEGVKYEKNSGNETEVTYTGLRKWSIISGEDAEVLDEDFVRCGLTADENHEYLVLEFNNMTTATFRNSHVDMFIR